MTPIESIDTAALKAARLGARGTRFLRRHSRSLAIGALVTLGGLSATAFGLAPMAPDAAQLPRRLVVEELGSAGLEPQLEALAAHRLSLYRSEITRPGDTVDTLLARLGVADPQASAFLRSDPVARRLFVGKAGKAVQARANAAGVLEELVARSAPDEPALAETHFTRLRIVREPAVGDAPRFASSGETAPLDKEVRLGSGTILQTLFAAADDARIPDAVAVQLAEMFANDIDFRRELRRGDRFTVVYEALTADGEPIGWHPASGRVLAAEFVNAGTRHSAIWFEANGKGAYFDLDGRSKRRSFLSSPLEFSRVTSGFSLRFHPILQTWRQHNGVDYGAPTGTPVRSVGDGVVAFAGRQNGYGNVVEIRHTAERTTVYAHLDRIDVREGQRIEQGSYVGTVGSTGWATGPHLHFEVKENGQHLDPLDVAKSSEAQVIAPESRAEFARWSNGIRAQLEAVQSVVGHNRYVE